LRYRWFSYEGRHGREQDVTGLQAQLGAAFLMALLGGVHCAAMCGGFVTALQVARPPQLRAGAFAAAYHVGRVGGYCAAGVLAGAIGGALFVADILPVQIGLLVLASVFLTGIGASLLGRAAWLRRLEPLGRSVWLALQPLAGRVLPPRSLPAAVVTGFVWGWIPCGMVYAALPLALVSGGAARGGAVMLAFGLGTVPNLLALGWGASTLFAGRRAQSLRRWLRPMAGAAILLFAASDLAHAARLAGADVTAVALLASVCHAAR
jgi:sulfite exporter TauE/SafE